MSQRVCIVCLELFQRLPKSRRRTCGRSCQVALAWTTNPEKRTAGIAASKTRPDQQEILARINAKRWADPQEHENLSIDNRERWADKTIARQRSRSIKAAWTPEKRQKAAERKTAEWTAKSPEERQAHMRPAIEASIASPNRNQRGNQRATKPSVKRKHEICVETSLSAPADAAP